MKVLIYVNTSAEVGDVGHLKVFPDDEAVDAWFKENDPENVAFLWHRLFEEAKRPLHRTSLR
jgi:hypothetical protein